MERESSWIEAAQGLADALGRGEVCRVEARGLSDAERGWSGAEVVRGEAVLSDGSRMPLILKCAERKERCAMARLTRQRQCVPASFSADLDGAAPAWMAMEDLGRQRLAPPDDRAFLRRFAIALASIHARDLDRGTEMPWLPAAGADHWRRVVSELSVDHFERKLHESESFARAFGRYLAPLREMGARFAREMTALCEEAACMTLAHGDLQMRDGAHVYDCTGAPRIIDFGFCGYAPLYIDLAGWFSDADLPLYHAALAAQGIVLRYADFEERARAARRYNGFVYLCPSVVDWRDGPTERTGMRLLQALKIILDGDFPERTVRYSPALFRRLLAEFGAADTAE